VFRFERCIEPFLSSAEHHPNFSQKLLSRFKRRMQQAERADELLACSREQRLEAVGVLKPLSVKITRLPGGKVRCSHAPDDKASTSGEAPDGGEKAGDERDGMDTKDADDGDDIGNQSEMLSIKEDDDKSTQAVAGVLMSCSARPCNRQQGGSPSATFGDCHNLEDSDIISTNPTASLHSTVSRTRCSLLSSAAVADSKTLPMQLFAPETDDSQCPVTSADQYSVVEVFAYPKDETAEKPGADMDHRATSSVGTGRSSVTPLTSTATSFEQVASGSSPSASGTVETQQLETGGAGCDGKKRDRTSGGNRRRIGVKVDRKRRGTSLQNGVLPHPEVVVGADDRGRSKRGRPGCCDGHCHGSQCGHPCSWCADRNSVNSVHHNTLDGSGCDSCFEKVISGTYTGVSCRNFTGTTTRQPSGANFAGGYR